MYSQGVSEEITGRAIKGKRDQIVLATKVRFAMGGDTNDVGLVAAQPPRAACEASLRRLGTEWIDLYQVHMWDKHTPLEETLSTLDDLVREGKVRYIGASNFAGWHLAKALGISALHGWEPFVCLQPEYSLITRDVERELIPLCRSEGLAVIPWSPLGGGILTGKYQQGRRLPRPARAARDTENPITFTYRLDDRAWNIVDAVEGRGARPGRARRRSRSTGCCTGRGVTAPIIGARNLTQLEDNLGAVGWELDDETAQGPRRGRACSASATRTSSSSTPADAGTDEGRSMELRQLGRTGMRVTEVCLGAMTFGRETPEDESGEILARYLDAGGNFVDTANTYNRGASEEILGRLLAGPARRDRARHQVPDADGLGPERQGRVPSRASASRSRRRCAGCRPSGSTCTRSTAGTRHAARGDGLDARRPRARGQGPVRRREQLHRLAARHRARRRARSTAGSRTCRLQPQYSLVAPRHRARAAPARRVRRPRGAAVEPARRRAALREVPAGTRPAGRHPRRPTPTRRRSSCGCGWSEERNFAVAQAVADLAGELGRTHGAGRAQLGAARAGRDRADPRRAHRRPDRGQPRCRRLDARAPTPGTGSTTPARSELGYPYEFIDWIHAR